MNVVYWFKKNRKEGTTVLQELYTGNCANDFVSTHMQMVSAQTWECLGKQKSQNTLVFQHPNQPSKMRIDNHG